MARSRTSITWIGSVGAPFVPGQNYRVDKMAETGLYDAGKRGDLRRIGPCRLQRKSPHEGGGLTLRLVQLTERTQGSLGWRSERVR